MTVLTPGPPWTRKLPGGEKLKCGQDAALGRGVEEMSTHTKLPLDRIVTLAPGVTQTAPDLALPGRNYLVPEKL